MAKRDDSQPSRVYKASDVHKRRVDRKVRADEPAAAPEQPSSDGVVLTPEFGRRTDQQKAADDRWFAAMREGASEPVPSPDSKAQSSGVATQDMQGMGEMLPRDAATPDAPGPGRAHRDAATLNAPGTGEMARRDATTPDAPGMGEKSGRGALRAPAEQGAPAGQLQDRLEPDLSSQPTGEIAPVSPASAGAPPAPAPESRAPKRRPSLAGIAAGIGRRKRIAAIAAAAVVVVVAIAVALFTWNRWYRFDDHADLQGEWYVVGTTTPVAIGEDVITLTDDVAYRYEIDPQDKTIRYTFGPMEGQGRYWLSDDRQYLVITDGDDFTSTGTALDDALHEFSDLMGQATGAGVKLPEGEGVIAFSRSPGFGALVHDRAKAAVAAAKEEVARKVAEEEAARQAAEEAAEWEEDY